MPQIILQLRNILADDNIKQYIQVIFANISDHISIDSVSIIQNNIQELNDSSTQNILVNYSTVGNTINVDFRSKIEKAISLCGRATLMSLTLPPKLIRLPGLRLILNNESKAIYSVLPVFALYLTNHPEIRNQFATQNIVDISFEFEQLNENQCRYTHSVYITTQPASIPMNLPNAYRRFAAILSNDSNLRESITGPNFRGMQFVINSDGTANVLISEAQPQASATAQQSTNTPRV